MRKIADQRKFAVGLLMSGAFVARAALPEASSSGHLPAAQAVRRRLRAGARRVCRGGDRREADRGRDQRHADLARPAFQLPRHRELRDMQVQTQGEFGGLGIEVTMENGLVKVVSPIDDTPASKAGRPARRLITHIDGEPVMGLTLSEAVEKMRGPVDSKIDLRPAQGQDEPFDVSLTRAVIKISPVRARRRRRRRLSAHHLQRADRGRACARSSRSSRRRSATS